MKLRYGLLVIVAVAMVFLGSCIGKIPLITVSSQTLNWEPGEPVALKAAPLNFEISPHSLFTWKLEKEQPTGIGDSKEWVDISDRIFSFGNNNSNALLYLPTVPDESRVRVTTSVQTIEGTTATARRTYDYGDRPGVLVEVFQRDQSFQTPDNWFRTSGIHETARTPVYFRYHESASPSAVTPIPDDPVEARYFWGVYPNSADEVNVSGSVYFHANNKLDAPTTINAVRNRFLDADIDEEIPGDKTKRWRVSLVADLDSMDPAKPWRTTAWEVRIFAQVSEETELYLIRAQQEDFVVTDIINLSPMLRTSVTTEDFDSQWIVLYFQIDEDDIGVEGPLWNEDYYFGLVVLDYQLQPASIGGDIFYVKGVQMVFSPDVSY